MKRRSEKAVFVMLSAHHLMGPWIGTGLGDPNLGNQYKYWVVVGGGGWHVWRWASLMLTQIPIQRALFCSVVVVFSPGLLSRMHTCGIQHVG